MSVMIHIIRFSILSPNHFFSVYLLRKKGIYYMPFYFKYIHKCDFKKIKEQITSKQIFFKLNLILIFFFITFFLHLLFSILIFKCIFILLFIFIFMYASFFTEMFGHETENTK